MLQDFLSDGRRVDMHVTLRRTDTLMPQHGLDSPQVSPSLQQCRCEGMAERMGRNGPADARISRHLLDHDQNHGASEMGATTVQKDIILLPTLDIHVPAAGEP